MAIRLLNEASSAAPTEIYFEIKLRIEVAERSWGSSDPVGELADAVAERLGGRIFDPDRICGIIARAGYTIAVADLDMIDGSLDARQSGNEASVYAIYGGTISLAEALTPEEGKKLASLINREFPAKETTFSLVGIPVDGYPLRKSDLDNPDAEVDCYVSSLAVSSNGKCLYFD